MKKIILILLTFISFLSFSQTQKDSLSKKKSHLESYYEKEKATPLSDNGQFFIFDISLPFRANKTYGEIDDNGNRSDYWFLPDGIGAKFGYGIHFSEWLCLGVNTGFDVVAQQKLVSTPIYASISLTRISEDASILVQFGYGKSFAIGRGNLSGYYKKFRIGVGDEKLVVFADLSLNGFPIYEVENSGSISLGISYLLFK